MSTDEFVSYGLLKGDGYKHGTVDHNRKEWAWTDHETGTRHHVNVVESFWHLFKASVASTHIHISEKYMDRYIGEFQFRSNRAGSGRLDRFPRTISAVLPGLLSLPHRGWDEGRSPTGGPTPMRRGNFHAARLFLGDELANLPSLTASESDKYLITTLDPLFWKNLAAMG